MSWHLNVGSSPSPLSMSDWPSPREQSPRGRPQPRQASGHTFSLPSPASISTSALSEAPSEGRSSQRQSIYSERTGSSDSFEHVRRPSTETRPTPDAGLQQQQQQQPHPPSSAAMRTSRANLRKLNTRENFLSTAASADSPVDAGAEGDGGKPQKTRSVLNLTASTLFGIYSPSSIDGGHSPSVNPSEPPTPWGTGAQTPARSTSIDHGFNRLAFTQPAEPRQEQAERPRKGAEPHSLRPRSRSMNTRAARRTRARAVGHFATRVLVLACMGVAYGEIIRHLHDSRRIAPVQVDAIKRGSWQYMGFWATAGVLLGFLMPWMDAMSTAKDTSDGEDWTDASLGPEHSDPDAEKAVGNVRASLGADWNPVVRSVGAFVGIAFAIRKLPWRSTLQVSCTLALVNPFIWFLIDRTAVGFSLSLAVAITGAASLMLVNPAMVPAPSTVASLSGLERLGLPSDIFAGLVSYESIGVATWIGSVLFCSCVFFGNIGRRLATERQIGDLAPHLR